MLNLLRTRIVFRSSFFVLTVALIVGGLFAVAAYSWEAKREHERAKIRMGELLSTVENTVSIACYLADVVLAKEAGQGLLKNEEVASIKIYSEAKMLAELYKFKGVIRNTQLAPSSVADFLIVRAISSPFNQKETVCHIELAADVAIIENQITARALFISSLLMLQALIMAGAVVYVIIYNIARPIKTISNRLHLLPPETGSQLPLPIGNEKDEIGQLVRDVNTLFSKLINILDDERELRIKHEIGERKFRTIFENSETGIFLLKPNGDVLSYNPAYLRIFALSDLAGPAVIRVSLCVCLHDYLFRLHAMLENANHEDRTSSEDFAIELGSPPQTRWINLILSTVDDGILQGLVNDITDRKTAEESANQLAMTDHLTGVANRLGFEKQMARMQNDMFEGKLSSFYLLMIDLDGFKEVNDEFGHGIGDQVLCLFTQILGRVVRKTDFIARMGGDEFVVVLKDFEQQEKVRIIAQKIIDEASLPMDVNLHQSIAIGVSIGISFVPTPKFKLAEVVQEADEAMYEAKRRGKNQFCMQKLS